MALIILVLMFVLFDVAAWYWGASSLDAPDSAEWERRRNWRGVGPK
jgi:hypothetical protein